MLEQIKSVSVTGIFKAYGIRDGISSGSEISVTFDVLPTDHPITTKINILEAKFLVDSMAMNFEEAKGMIPPEMKAEIHQRYKTAMRGMREQYEAQLKEAFGGE